MYFWVILLLMFVFPLSSIAAELLIAHRHADPVLVIGRWFVFWAVGVRLFTAGLRQALGPQFTAREIFGITSREPLVIVRELGFANLSIGLIGLAAVLKPGWVVPAALAGGVFYALAAVQHVAKRGKNRMELWATASGVFIALVLLGFVVVRAARLPGLR